MRVYHRSGQGQGDQGARQRGGPEVTTVQRGKVPVAQSACKLPCIMACIVPHGNAIRGGEGGVAEGKERTRAPEGAKEQLQREEGGVGAGLPHKMLCTVRAEREGAGGGTRPEHRGGAWETRGTNVPQIALHRARSDGRTTRGKEQGREEGPKGSMPRYVLCNLHAPEPLPIPMTVMDSKDGRGRVQAGHEKED